MIIEALLGLFSWILSAILFPLHVQSLPATFATVFGSIIAYLVTGAAYVSAYIDTPYIIALLTFVIAFSGVLNTYRVIMWILKKIPFLNIK